MKRILKSASLLLLIFLLHSATALYQAADCMYYARMQMPYRNVYKAFFCPDDNIKKLLLGLIHSEKRMILMAVYQITDDDIVDALVAARKRGVTIHIVTDTSCKNSPYSKIPKLRRNRIPVKIYGKPYLIMHNKYFVFGKNINGRPLLWTGSANATAGGVLRNEENVIITEHPSLIKTYVDKFRGLEKKVKPTRCGEFPEQERKKASLLQFLLSWFSSY